MAFDQLSGTSPLTNCLRTGLLAILIVTLIFAAKGMTQSRKGVRKEAPGNGVRHMTVDTKKTFNS